MKVDILGVKIDRINQEKALVLVEQWAKGSNKHYIVTPNLEFILAASKDPQFKQVLNDADLAIPDSSSLGFSYWLLKKPVLLRLLFWPVLLFPFKQLIQFDRVSGTDLMDALCKVSAEKGFTTGFLGGRKGIAKKCAECLQKKYPKLQIAFINDGGLVDDQGQLNITDLKMPKLDILFVAFGHIKQEKWISNNLKNIPVKVAMGVGGAFDYLSGEVIRSPQWLRSLGFEWLFRLIVQPWRIKRQLVLWQYLWLLTSKR